MDNELKKEIIELVKELENKDSLEIGNSKTGSVKVYCDFSRSSEAEEKVKNAIKVLKDNRSSVFGEVKSSE